MKMLVSCRSEVSAGSDKVLAQDGRVEHVNEYGEVADRRGPQHLQVGVQYISVIGSCEV